MRERVPSTAAASTPATIRAALRRQSRAADPMTTILIADDQALVRVGLRKIIENETDMVVVSEAAAGEDAVAAAARTRPESC